MVVGKPIENQRLLWAFVRVNPGAPLEIARAKLVHADQRMNLTEFDRAMEGLKETGAVFESEPGRLKAVRRPAKLFDEGEPEFERTAVRLKFPRIRIHKAKVKLLRRRYIEGYKCRKCGAFVDRSWGLRKIRKCPSCGRTKYRGKPVLVKSERVEEKLTKKGRELYKLARESAWKIKMPTLKELKIDPSQVVSRSRTRPDAQVELEALRRAGDERPLRVVQARGQLPIQGYKCRKCGAFFEHDWRMKKPKQCFSCGRTTYYGRSVLVKATRVVPKTLWHIIYDPTMPRSVVPPKKRERGRPRVHLTREQYKGSNKASEAAKKAWASRRARVAVGFYKDEENRTRPVTKSTAELNRKKVIQKPSKFKGVKPKQKRKARK